MTNEKTKNNEADSIRYSNMSIKQLDTEITEEQEFIDKHCRKEERDYTKRERAEAERQIERYNEFIKQKKEDYLESIKSDKKYIGENKKRLKELDKRKEEDLKFRENRLFVLASIKEIKTNLEKDSNYYKKLGDKKMIQPIYKDATLEELEKELKTINKQMQHIEDNDYSTQSEVELDGLKTMGREIVELINLKKGDEE